MIQLKSKIFLIFLALLGVFVAISYIIGMYTGTSAGKTFVQKTYFDDPQSQFGSLIAEWRFLGSVSGVLSNKNSNVWTITDPNNPNIKQDLSLEAFTTFIQTGQNDQDPTTWQYIKSDAYQVGDKIKANVFLDKSQGIPHVMVVKRIL